MSFITLLGLTIGNLLFYFDTKFNSSINRTIVEKNLCNLRQTLKILIFMFFMQTLLIDLNFLNNHYTNSWDQLLIFWLSFFILLFFISSYYYYTSLYKLLKLFNFTPIKFLPTLNLYRVLPSEYFIATGCLYNSLAYFITVSDIIYLYVIFEITNIIIYTIIGITCHSPKASEASVKYYFISFLSSLFCLWGTSYIYGFTGVSNYSILVALLYNIEILPNANSFGIVVGVTYILLGFFIKLGVFPCHLWIINVYEKTANLTFLLLITFIKLGFYFSMLQFILSLIIKPLFGFSLFKDIFIAAALGSAIFGVSLLITRGTIKGFLTANSVVSWGILFISLSSNMQLKLVWEDQIIILQWNLQYLIVYLILINVIYNIWLTNYIYIYWNKITYYYFQRNNWFLQFYINLEGRLLNREYVINKNIYQIHRLTTLHYIFKKYNDTLAIVTIWIIAGFPPFLLFLTKFYIVCHAWSSSLEVAIGIVWFTISTFGIYGYIKGLSLFIVRFKKHLPRIKTKGNII